MYRFRPLWWRLACPTSCSGQAALVSKALGLTALYQVAPSFHGGGHRTVPRYPTYYKVYQLGLLGCPPATPYPRPGRSKATAAKLRGVPRLALRPLGQQLAHPVSRSGQAALVSKAQGLTALYQVAPSFHGGGHRTVPRYPTYYKVYHLGLLGCPPATPKPRPGRSKATAAELRGVPLLATLVAACSPRCTLRAGRIGL